MVDKERLRSSKAKWVVPLVGCCFAVGVAALLMTPMLMMEPRDIPVALLSEDAGADVGDSSVNIGDTLVENLAGGDDAGDAEVADGDGATEGDGEGDGASNGSAVGSDAVRWIVVDSRQEMDALLEAGECYGALVVPRDFSESQIAVRGRETLGWTLVDKLPDLASGATSLAEGAQGVADGAGSVADGAGTLSDGASALAEGTGSLAQGAGTLAQGASSLASGAQKLASGVGTLQEKASSLPDGIGKLSKGADSLADGVGKVQAGASSLAEGAEGVKGAVDKAGELADAAKGAAAAGSAQGAAQAAAGASQVLDATAEGAAKLAEGATALEKGAAASKKGADSLAGGLGTLAKSAPALTKGVGSVAQGANSLAQGAQSLDEGAATLAQGAATVHEGAQSLADGAGSLAEGSRSLAEGAHALAEGADTLASGLTSADEVLSLLPAVSDKMLDDASDSGEGAFDLSDADLDLGVDLGDEDAASTPAIPKAASLELVINQGKNPMVSSSLGSAVSTLGSASGVEVEVTYLNPLPEGLSMGYTHMILMMMTYLGSYITAVVIYNLFMPSRGRHESLKGTLGTVGIQAAYAVACALVVGACATGIIYAATGADISYGDLWLYVAICSLTFQALVLGSLDLFGMAGMAVPVGLLIIGMGTAYLPTEFLPAFYQDFVYPWDPLRFMADGYRGILYLGEGFWNPSSQTLMIVVAIGVAMMLGSVLKGQITQKRAAKTEALA